MLTILWKKDSLVYYLKQELQDLFTLKELINSLIYPLFSSHYYSLNLFFFFFSPTKLSISFTSNIRSTKSIRAWVWSDYWVIWCKQYLILLILLFSSPLINVKLQISYFLPFTFSFKFLSVAFFLYYWLIFSPTFRRMIWFSYSSSSSRESCSFYSFIFLFFRFHLIGWSLNS